MYWLSPGLGWALCPADTRDFQAAPALCPDPAGFGCVLSTTDPALPVGIVQGSSGSEAVPTGNRTAEDLLQCTEMGAKL